MAENASSARHGSNMPLKVLGWLGVIIAVPIIAMMVQGSPKKDSKWDIYVQNDTGKRIQVALRIRNIGFEGLTLDPGARTLGCGLKTVPDQVTVNWSGENGEGSQTVSMPIPEAIDRERFFAITISITKDNKAVVRVTQ